MGKIQVPLDIRVNHDHVIFDPQLSLESIEVEPSMFREELDHSAGFPTAYMHQGVWIKKAFNNSITYRSLQDCKKEPYQKCSKQGSADDGSS